MASVLLPFQVAAAPARIRDLISGPHRPVDVLGWFATAYLRLAQGSTRRPPATQGDPDQDRRTDFGPCAASGGLGRSPSLDRLGGKAVWMGALALFLLGSVGASLAWNAPSLVACRVVQGIGGGLMLPVLTTLLIRAADGRSLGRVTAVVTLPVLLGPIFGPLIGGLLPAGTWSASPCRRPADRRAGRRRAGQSGHRGPVDGPDRRALGGLHRVGGRGARHGALLPWSPLAPPNGGLLRRWSYGASGSVR
jgi:Major Facilitator Superfamily